MIRFVIDGKNQDEGGYLDLSYGMTVPVNGSNKNVETVVIGDIIDGKGTVTNIANFPN